jgi:hypothetical protein
VQDSNGKANLAITYMEVGFSKFICEEMACGIWCKNCTGKLRHRKNNNNNNNKIK